MGEVSQEANMNFYKILLKDKIGIVRNQKVDGAYIETDVGGLEGQFVKVEMSSYTNKDGDEVELVRLYLKDADGEYCLSTARTSVARSLINSLAGAEKLGKIRLSVYGSVKNGKTRPAISVRNNGEQTQWKYSIAEQKEKIEEIKDSKGTVIKRDYSELNELLKSELDVINSKIDADAMLNELLDKDDE